MAGSYAALPEGLKFSIIEFDHPLQAALATRESALRVGIDSFWAPLAMFTTQDLALRLQFRDRLVLNPENLPHHGPVLLAPTHRARWDALMLPMAAIPSG